jgi:homoserine O-acetyltransferase
MGLPRAALAFVFAITSFAVSAADYPAPKQGNFIAKDFKFHTGEVMGELKLHYVTIGEPTGQPVLVLHGTGQSAASMLTPAFAGELFGAGQRSTRRNTTSSFPMRWATVNRQSPRTE